jgi:(p)ppGpp synthase/HD superfamily hydrolase
MWSQDLYLEALNFAAEAHGDQMYGHANGAKVPYVTHVAMVAMEVIAALEFDQVVNPDLAVQCALLHDTLEDTNTPYIALETKFGTAVTNGVQALSKNLELPKDQQMQDSLNRIKQQPLEVWMVKLADRINNLQPPPPHWTLEKKRAYQQEARVILQHLGTASPYLAARLEQKIETYL